MQCIGIKRLQRLLDCILCSPMDMLPKPIIREMTYDDLDAVMAIEALSYPVPWKREHFGHELSAPHSFPFIVEVGGAVVGYVCLMLLFEEAQILNVAVAPAARGCGLARKLLLFACALAREKGAEIMALEVRASNRSAISLYHSLGFERTGIRANYYEGKDDALLMEKHIKEDN